MHTFIIAEAGPNHNGDIMLAKKLIDIAVAADADVVKFQTFKTNKVVTADARKADYQIANTGSNESQAAMLKKLELSPETHRELIAHCRQRDIMFMSTPFDLDSIDLLCGFGLETFKIPSGEITNLPYLRKLGALRKRLIMSTGMADMDEVKAALNVLVASGTPKDDIVVLHCHTDYPTAMENVNLRAMCTIRDTLGVNVGYSDHTLGIEVPIAAVALGAMVIEKHFTLDRQMVGPDHKASLEPRELKAMVEAIRNIEKALGDGVKKRTVVEREIMAIARKSIVAERDIHAGKIFTEENITTKRPGTGISPMKWDMVIGKTAKRDFITDEAIEL